MALTPIDLVAQQDEYNKHVWRMCLWPTQWNARSPSAKLVWKTVVLDPSQKSAIPTAPGIYSLLVQPNIANHTGCSYLMYIGKASSLRSRFGNYLTTEKLRRPKIIRLLEMYKDHLHFCYSTVPKAKLDTVEEQLYSAYVPPCNTQFSGELSRSKRAF